MNSSTIDYYNSHSDELVIKYDSADVSKVHGILDKYISPAQKVLDLGFGSGRDMLHLKRRGVNVWGIDASNVFVTRFKKEYPSLKDRLFTSVLPNINLNSEYEHFFDTVYSIATWMHLPKEEHFEAILSIKKHLKPNGKVILSYSYTPRKDDPRFFEDVVPEQVAMLFESFGFNLIDSIFTSDGLGRDEIKWVTQVFQYDESSVKGIDQIESILSQDSKDTTYKFALLKIFSEIATTPLNRFARYADGYVYFPSALIVEKWISHYWKLMDSKTLIHQKMGGEANRQLAFRSPLEDTIEFYRSKKNRTNPYYEFRKDSHQGIIKDSVEYHLLKKLFNSVLNTIINGPVKYAGSSFDDTSFFTTGTGVKSYPQRAHQFSHKTAVEECIEIGIQINAYKELIKYGSWINDSILLRWAKFTEKIMTQVGESFSTGKVITRLSVDYIQERETQVMRKLYDKYKVEIGQLDSVWGNKNLHTYEVDHVMPYSVYGNNDLWNLLPTSRNENNAKRDALVTTKLIKNNRDTIFNYWEYMQDQVGTRFNHEVYTTLDIDPLSANWKESLLNGVCEQLEVTASIRGLKRWSGLR